jgi:membrane protease YdiL (CAAX protease family)
MHAPTGPGATDLAYDVGLRMFVGVALVEEMLLRSGLFGAMRHRRRPRRSGCPPWPSVLGTSSPHSRGTATRVRFTTMVRMIGPVAALGLTVGATTLAGSAFAWLRLRSGHVVTTVLVHAAINGTVRPGRPRCVPVTGAPEARPCRRRHATAPTARARR